MVMTYTCICKCYFMEGIRKPGDRMILDTSVGDACPHLVRTPSEEQVAMQVAEKENSSTLAPAVPKAAGAKAVSKGKRPATGNGSKTQ